MTPLRPDTATAAPQRNARSADAAAGIKNLQQLIELRWIAVVGQVFTIEMAHYSLNLTLPVREMLLVVGCLAVFNVVSLLRLRTGVMVRNVELFLALLIDVAVLTVQLYLSGGTSNPFVFLYLLQITLGAVLLRGAYIWSIVIITLLCFGVLATHHLPLELPQDLHQGLSSLYVIGLLVCFVLNATLVVVFITRINLNLRERDARLAAARRRRVEEEHIVRMGLLASGAAHELGTPLSTLAVILGDWQHLPHFSSEPELADDVAEMQAQVARCKAIVSGILLSAGAARGESSSETTVCAFLDSVVNAWCERRNCSGFHYHNAFGDDLPMVADSAIQQMIGNVLDNAADASPQAVWFEARREDDALVLTVWDQGPGFAPQLLPQIGKPYQSTKGHPGGGLGLFLVFNVARTLGGSVAARNRPEGGAEVTIELPLAAIALPEAKA